MERRSFGALKDSIIVGVCGGRPSNDSIRIHDNLQSPLAMTTRGIMRKSQKKNLKLTGGGSRPSTDRWEESLRMCFSTSSGVVQ
jgi:hypothetical protein